MTNHRVVIALVCPMLALAISAHAQDGSAQARSGMQPEFTPYAFLGSGAAGGVGAAVRWPLPGPLSFEIETSVRRSDVAAFGTNWSLLYDFPDVGRVTPYVAGGVGLDQYAFADSSPAGEVVPQARTAFSLNAGGGVRIRGDETWGVRTDARWVKGVGQRAPERWRLYNGVTLSGKGR